MVAVKERPTQKSTSKKNTAATKGSKGKPPSQKKAVKGQKVTGFRTFAMHSSNASDSKTFETLRAERRGLAGFAITESTGISNTDPETAARSYLMQTLASEEVPSFTSPQTADSKSEFKSLGTETLPLTNTKTVKFRQNYNQIPVYSSLVTVELDENNEFLSINSALGTPTDVSPIAKVAPKEALDKALALAGTKSPIQQFTPRLNYYLDKKLNRWRLVYIIEDVPLEKLSKKESVNVQYVMDFVIDAHTGALVAELPRTPTMAEENEVEATDGMGQKRLIRFKPDSGNKKVLFDEKLNVLTFDFAFGDPQAELFKLPGTSVKNPPDWAAEAVSAHANAAAVASFLREVLKRKTSTIRVARLYRLLTVLWPPITLGQKQWLNAFWTPVKRQMVYGQVLHGPNLRSLAVNLDVVGHEMFHGVTNDTSRLEYKDESGALNESYSDIFGIIISNFDKANIADWDWELGENLTSNDKPLRDLSKPSRFNQPEHMDHFEVMSRDFGGVHINSGIHNFAAFKIMTTRDAQQKFLFTATELAAIFYIALTQQLSRSSGFSASRRGVTLAAQTLFRNDPEPSRNAKIAAIAKGFDAVGISEPES
jgi:Zn-dependent metalloprotease